MSRKKEFLALVFGVLIIFIIFGDAVYIQSGGSVQVGNLDTAFGVGYWHLVDVILPIASIVIFLLYGKMNGEIRINLKSGLIFLAFLSALTLLIVDDIFAVFGHPIVLSQTYWGIVRWMYFIVSIWMFFAFGVACSSRNVQIK